MFVSVRSDCDGARWRHVRWRCRRHAQAVETFKAAWPTVTLTIGNTYLRLEQRARAWLEARGVPARDAIALLWTIKLLIIGGLLYVAFWLAFLVAFVVASAWVALNFPWNEPEPEWRNGPAGYGLYTYDDLRIDPHVHDDYGTRQGETMVVFGWRNIKAVTVATALAIAPQSVALADPISPRRLPQLP